MLAVAALLALVVALVVRTFRLFFDSVARGETHVRWIPADLAQPLGVLLRGAIIVLAILFAAPLITGGDSGALSRLATAVLLALALGAVPLLASIAVGLPTVFGRALRPGEMVELGGRRGQVRAVTLLGVELEDPEGAELRIPHLVAFLHPARALGAVPRQALEVVVGGAEDQARVQSVLLEAAGSHASGARAELVWLDLHGARWKVTSIHPDLGQRVATALRDAQIALGRPGARERPMSALWGLMGLILAAWLGSVLVGRRGQPRRGLASGSEAGPPRLRARPTRSWGWSRPACSRSSPRSPRSAWAGSRSSSASTTGGSTGGGSQCSGASPVHWPAS